MAPYDWSRFTLRIPIKADVTSIYKVWTSQAALEHWFLRLAQFTKKDGTTRPAESPLEPGDTYLWRWHGWDDNTFETGTMLELNGMDFIRFSFGKAGDVSVKIKVEEGGTICELAQENIPVDEKSKVNYHLGCMSGWTFHLTNLKNILEGGTDLRNRNVQLRNVVNS